MNKKLLFTSVVVILTICSAVAQKRSKNLVSDFKDLIGCWQGTLNYSGTMIRKPFLTTAQLVIKQIGNGNKFEFLHIYTTNTNENVTDTIAISKDARKLNGETIKSKRRTKDGAIEIVTESVGFDSDNNKSAIVRQVYTIGKDVYRYKKQVQLKGQVDWLDRQEFKYERQRCISKS